jgi:hypothetical protein
MNPPTLEPPEKNNSLTIDQLSEIKDGLQFDYSSDVSESDYKDSPKVKKKVKSKKLTISSYNKLESRIHYMKLDLVNKDLEIEELKKKLETFNKYETIFKQIDSIFERLDNGINLVNTRLDSKQELPIFKYLSFLEYTDTLCTKIIDKYTLQLNTELFPLFDKKHTYLKNSIQVSFTLKENELRSISQRITKKIIYLQQKELCKYFLILFVFLSIICIFIINIFFLK